jgi:hypothetical protein
VPLICIWSASAWLALDDRHDLVGAHLGQDRRGVVAKVAGKTATAFRRRLTAQGDQRVMGAAL